MRKCSSSALELHCGMLFSSAEFTIGAVRAAIYQLKGQPEIAFSGRSNVGKSSLINRLLQRKKLARTSSTPGKTQQLNTIGSTAAFILWTCLVTALFRAALACARDWAVWSRVMWRDANRYAVPQLIDMRHGPTDLDRMMIDWLKELARLSCLSLPRGQTFS